MPTFLPPPPLATAPGGGHAALRRPRRGIATEATDGERGKSEVPCRRAGAGCRGRGEGLVVVVRAVAERVELGTVAGARNRSAKRKCVAVLRCSGGGAEPILCSL
jgi:hypothetical protein